MHCTRPKTRFSPAAIHTMFCGLLLAGVAHNANAQPLIEIQPSSLTAGVAQGQTASAALSIMNSGDSALNWWVQHEPIALQHLGGLVLQADENHLFSAVIDPAGAYAYFGTLTSPGRVVKVDLNTFEQVDSLVLESDENDLYSAVIDPAGTYAYFGSLNNPGRVVKIDLNTFERVAALTLGDGEGWLVSAAIDPAGTYAYFGTSSIPGRVVKIDLNTFERVAVLTLESDDGPHGSALIDPAGAYAYFGTNTEPGQVVKVDLDTFERVGILTAADGEDVFRSAIMDPVGAYAYFGTSTIIGMSDDPGQVVKIDLNTFEQVDTLVLESGESELFSAVIDPAGAYAYFGTSTEPGQVVKIDLETFERIGALTASGSENVFRTALIDPAGAHAYFGTSTSPGRVVKVAVHGVDCLLPDWLSADPDTGNVPGGDSQLIEVGLDASDLAAGAHTANLCVASNDAVLPVVEVPVELTVNIAVLNFVPDSVDLGAVGLGDTSPTIAVMLENSGLADATGLSFSIIHPPSPGGYFSIDVEDCGATLGAGDACQLGLTFTALATGVVEAEVTVSSAQGIGTTLPVSATGVDLAQPEDIFEDRFEQ